MKVISWNCNMAFRKKSSYILKYNPDLICVQECENEARLKFGNLVKEPDDFIWIGDNESKGVGMFSYNGYRLKKHESYTNNFRYVIPIQVSRKKEYTLLAIWAMPHPKDKNQGYVGQVWGAVNYYQNILKENTILLGDFNSNVLWDKERKKGNHTDLVSFLKKNQIASIYHQKNNLQHGDETDPTFYLLKNKNKPYHMDYCFASNNLIKKNTAITIGIYEEWIKRSDHMPLIISGLG